MSYLVYKEPRGIFRYTIAKDGHFTDVAVTFRGALHAIRKDRRKEVKPPYWEYPVIYREEEQDEAPGADVQAA